MLMERSRMQKKKKNQNDSTELGLGPWTFKLNIIRFKRKPVQHRTLSYKSHTCIHTYLTTSRMGFSGPITHNWTEQQQQLLIPTGRRQTKCSREVEPRTTRIKFNERLSGEVLNPGSPDLKETSGSRRLPHYLLLWKKRYSSPQRRSIKEIRYHL